MHFAIVDNVEREAAPKLTGVCKCCGSEVIGKCGVHIAWHWAHSSRAECDPWWETETVWHRNWKNHFPLNCQEVIHYDPATKEKHIADIKTPHGIIIEFQNSPIKPEELISRESFYESMIWVVNGCRSDFDKINFQLGLYGHPLPLASGKAGYQFAWYSRGKLPHNWSRTRHPTFLDFGEDTILQLLSFELKTKHGLVKPISKADFISDLLSGNLPQADSLAPGVGLHK